MKSGNKQYDSGNYDSAIKNYNLALSVDSENPAAYYFRGLSYLKKDDQQQESRGQTR